MQAEKARCYVVGTPPGGESGRAAEWVNQHHVMIGHHQGITPSMVFHEVWKSGDVLN